MIYEIRQSEIAGIFVDYIVGIGPDGLESIIPADKANNDYRAYLATLEQS